MVEIEGVELDLVDPDLSRDDLERIEEAIFDAEVISSRNDNLLVECSLGVPWELFPNGLNTVLCSVTKFDEDSNCSVGDLKTVLCSLTSVDDDSIRFEGSGTIIKEDFVSFFLKTGSRTLKDEDIDRPCKDSNGRSILIFVPATMVDKDIFRSFGKSCSVSIVENGRRSLDISGTIVDTDSERSF